MRVFTAMERSVIRKLAVWNRGTASPMEEFLAKNIFTAQSPQAVIIQPQRRHAVLYHVPVSSEAKQNELERHFFELVALLSYLRTIGYITLYGGAPVADNKTLYYLHASFDKPRIEGNTIFLNEAGDFTRSPEVILDKHGAIRFKGIRLEGDLYQLVLSNMTGTVCVSQALLSLLAEPPPPKRLYWYKATAALVLVLTHAAVSYVGLRVHTIISDFTTTIESLRSQQAELTKKIAVPQPQPGKGAPTAQAPATPPEYYGVDISRWNGNFSGEIDQIPKLSFAISKATEGVTLRDDQFENNRRLLRAKGIVQGGYHLFRQSDDPVAQADFYLATLGAISSGDISPVVDVENASLPQQGLTDPTPLQANVLLMLKTLETRTGRSPILYTNFAFALKYLGNAEFARYRLWLAEYTSGQPEIPGVWRTSGLFIWQKSASYKVGSSEFDLDVFRGSRAELLR